MALNIYDTNSKSANNAADSITVNTDGSNGRLIVFIVSCRLGSWPTNPTIDGVDLDRTGIASCYNKNSSPNTRTVIYVLENPTPNSLITCSVSWLASAVHTLVAFSITGADPNGMIEAHTPSQDLRTTATKTSSVSMDCSAGSLVIDGICKAETAEEITADASQIVDINADYADQKAGVSHKISTGGTVDMSWSWPTTNRISAQSAIAIKPAPSSALGRLFQVIIHD